MTKITTPNQLFSKLIQKVKVQNLNNNNINANKLETSEAESAGFTTEEDMLLRNLI